MTEIKLINPSYIERVNYAANPKKVKELVEAFQTTGYKGRPVIILDFSERIALTGSHRLQAASIAGIKVPALLISGEELDNAVLIYEASRDDEKLDVAEELLEEGKISQELYDALESECDSNCEEFIINK